MKIKEALQSAIEILKNENIDFPNLKARLILAYVLGVNKEYLIVHDDNEIEYGKNKDYEKQINRLIDGVPLQYITKNQEFMKMNFYVNENVLIPRQDTEILVEETIKIAQNMKGIIKILDLCTGSGAIAVSCSRYIENSDVNAIDISAKAIDVAKKNAENNKVNVEYIESDLFEKIQNKKFNIIVSNPPYVITDEICNLEKQVKKEPRLALDGGKDGLKFYKKIIEQAPLFLDKQGYLCLEIGYNQKEEVIKLIKENENYTQIYSKKDLYGNDRIVITKLQ